MPHQRLLVNAAGSHAAAWQSQSIRRCESMHGLLFALPVAANHRSMSDGSTMVSRGTKRGWLVSSQPHNTNGGTVELKFIGAGLIAVASIVLTGCVGAPSATVTVTETTSPSATASVAERTREPSSARTPIESPSATVEPTSAPEPEVVTYEGSGTKIIKVRKPEDGPVLATFTHNGSSNFAVWSLDSDLEQLDLLVNTIGDFAGTTILDRNDGENTARIEVEADGTWTIELAPLSTASQFTDKAQGTGPDVLIYQGPTGVATLKNQGQGNFAVWFFSTETSDLAANEIGNYSGEAVIPEGPTAVQIESEGKWSISVQ